MDTTLLNVAPVETGWIGRLHLEYAPDDGRTYLSRKRHSGPLAVQKSLYPEGPAVCHTLILHPPAGIVGGDMLDIAVKLNGGSHALITTPGAAKWYRSTGTGAVQRIKLSVGPEAMLEWLPQETIVFNGAMAKLHSVIDLAEEGHYLGWDILCLGRTAAGEKFDCGSLHQVTDISIAGTLAWSEHCNLKGGSPLLKSTAGLANAPISGLMIAGGKNIPAELVARCRAVTMGMPARCGISTLPKILLARYVGHSCEEAKGYFTALWRELRPALAARPVVLPRIWST